MTLISIFKTSLKSFNKKCSHNLTKFDYSYIYKIKNMDAIQYKKCRKYS